MGFTEQGRGKIAKGVARMSTDKEGVANNPGYCDTPDEVTKSYFVQQTVNTIYHSPDFVVSNGGGRKLCAVNFHHPFDNSVHNRLKTGFVRPFNKE